MLKAITSSDGDPSSHDINAKMPNMARLVTFIQNTNGTGTNIAGAMSGKGFRVSQSVLPPYIMYDKLKYQIACAKRGKVVSMLVCV